jgi:prepilin-type N-terminal cleavage/methylation domain-containing protein
MPPVPRRHSRRSIDIDNPFVSKPSIRAFTLVELLIAISILVILTLLFASLLNSAAAVTERSGKRIESEGQIRPLFDRMATDFDQMVTRRDIDFYGKGTAAGGAMAGNDRIAFYSMAPGDYPSTGSQSPFSVIAYKINSSLAVANTAVFTRLQRMARGLLMNGDASANNGASPGITDGPLAFSPATISGIWTSITSNATTDSKYELAGPQVFRFEYYYLLTNGTLSATPWDPTLPGHTDPGGMRDVVAIITAIATIDPKSRVLLTNAQVSTIAGTLADYATGSAPGWLLSQWQAKLDNPINASVKLMPRPALSNIRLFERYHYLGSSPR